MVGRAGFEPAPDGPRSRTAAGLEGEAPPVGTTGGTKDCADSSLAALIDGLAAMVRAVLGAGPLSLPDGLRTDIARLLGR